MLSRSPKDSRVMSVISNLPQLQKVGSFSQFGISKFEEFRNSTTASSLLLQLVLLHTLCVHWSRIPQLDGGFQFRNVPRVSQIPLTGEDPRNRRTGMQNLQRIVVVPHPHYTPTLQVLFATRYLQENPGSKQAVAFLVRIQAPGLSVPVAKNKVYPGL